MKSRRDRREFIELPFRLHATSQQWIPPIRLERKLFHSRRMHAYFKHAEAQELVARRAGGSWDGSARSDRRRPEVRAPASSAASASHSRMISASSLPAGRRRKAAREPVVAASEHPVGAADREEHIRDRAPRRRPVPEVQRGAVLGGDMLELVQLHECDAVARRRAALAAPCARPALDERDDLGVLRPKAVALCLHVTVRAHHADDSG